MQRGLEAALGAKFRMRAPADVGQQAGRVTQSRVGGALLLEQRRDPAVEQVAMFGEATDAAPLFAGCADQRIHVAHVAGQVAMEHALAQPIGRNDEAFRAELAPDDRQQLRRVGQRGGA